MVLAACPAPAWPQYEEAAPLRRTLPVKVVTASATHPQPPLRPPKYHFFGNGTWAASARGNSVKGQQTGANTVRFSHDDAEVSWEMPYLTIRGVLFGERYLKYGGSMRFQDAAHGLTCDVDIDTEGPGFFRSFFRRKKAHAQDAVHGVLRGKDGEELDVLTGSWLSHLEWEKGVSVDKGGGGVGSRGCPLGTPVGGRAREWRVVCPEWPPLRLPVELWRGLTPAVLDRRARCATGSCTRCGTR